MISERSCDTEDAKASRQDLYQDQIEGPFKSTLHHHILHTNT